MSHLRAAAQKAKYTPRVRAQAVRICQVMASNFTWVSDVTECLGISRRGAASVLARMARLEAITHVPNGVFAEKPGWAEAECLLREGWTPCDGDLKVTR